VLQMNDQVITALPAGIGDLSSLEALNIRGNLLQELPADIVRLKHLHTMDLKANEIKIIPTTFHHLTSLRHLNLSFNIEMDTYIECRKLQGMTLETLDISYTVPISSQQLQQIREWLPETKVRYAFTRK